MTMVAKVSKLPLRVRPVRVTAPASRPGCPVQRKIVDLKALIEIYEDRLVLFRYELKQLLLTSGKGLA